MDRGRTRLPSNRRLECDACDQLQGAVRYRREVNELASVIAIHSDFVYDSIYADFCMRPLKPTFCLLKIDVAEAGG